MLDQKTILCLKSIINLSFRLGLLPCKWTISEESLTFTAHRLRRLHIPIFLILCLLYETFLICRWIQAETAAGISRADRIQCRYYVFGNMIYTVRAWMVVANYERHHMFLNRAWQYFQRVKGNSITKRLQSCCCPNPIHFFYL